MKDLVHVVQVCQTLEYGQRDGTYDINANGSDFLVNPVQRAFVHVFHANIDATRTREERTPVRDDAVGITRMHNMYFSQHSCPQGRLCTPEGNL